MTDPQETVLRLEVRVDEPPAEPGTLFGLQDASGTLHAGTRLADGAQLFSCEVRVAGGPGNGSPNFLGPFTHGSRALRHLYLGHRPAEGAETAWLKRIKLPLSPITWPMIESARDGAITTTVDGRASATVPVTWHVAQGSAPETAARAGAEGP